MTKDSEQVRRALTADERAVVSTSLQVAANKYDDNVKMAQAMNQPHLAAQFDRQAAEARQLAALLEVADAVTLTSGQ